MLRLPGTGDNPPRNEASPEPSLFVDPPGRTYNPRPFPPYGAGQSPQPSKHRIMRKLLQTPKFDVMEREIRLRDGSTADRAFIDHPGAVTILPIRADGTIVMIRNERFSIDETLIELPAGTLEQGEDPVVCAHRELEEEAGVRAGRMSPLVEFFTSPGICNEKMYAFVATDLTEVGQKLEPGENISVVEYKPNEVKTLLAGGKLRDGKTIAVLGAWFTGGEKIPHTD
jgi:ADP-ribose pyrophosphatase